jgi:type I restriction enzyme S subunit
MSFPAYPAYRDSGVPWLGQVPAGWAVVPVKAIASCNDDVLPENMPPDEVIEYVEISDVEEGRGIIHRTPMTFAEAPSRARRKVQAGDVIVSTVRTYLRAIATIPPDCDRLVVSTGFAVFRPRRVLASFLGYLFRTEFVVAQIIARSVGVSYPAINASEVARLPIPLPPPAEQRAIAAFLDRECGKMDALVAEQERLIALLKEKQQAVISHAVTKGLDPNAPMKDSGVAWLGQVPAHWEVRRLKYLGEAITGLTYDPSQVVSEPEGGTLVLRSSNVQRGRIVLDDNVYVATQVPPELIAKPGDILICSRNGSRALIGKNATITDEAVGATWGAFMTVFRSMYSRYLSCVFNSPLFEAQAGAFLTSTINQLTIGMLNDFAVPLPPPEERDAVADFIAAARATTERLIDEAERAIALLKERRAALISAAVTGKIDVRGLAAPAETEATAA